jgi:hypothetical protein
MFVLRFGRLRRAQTSAETKRYQLNLAPSVAIPVPTLMFLFEACNDIRDRWHIEFISLTAISQVQTSLILKRTEPPFRAEFLPCRGL